MLHLHRKTRPGGDGASSLSIGRAMIFLGLEHDWPGRESSVFNLRRDDQMNKSSCAFWCLLLVILIALPLAAQADDKVIESYNATITMLGGPGRGPIPIRILIYSITPDAEIAKLAETLRSGGQDALVDALDKAPQRGRISPVGQLGNDLNYVRVLNTEKGRVIRMISNRNMSFMELTRGGRSTDYPFGIVELVIGNDGKIEGTVIGGAKIDVKDNALEVESYGIQPLRLMSLKKTQ